MLPSDTTASGADFNIRRATVERFAESSSAFGIQDSLVQCTHDQNACSESSHLPGKKPCQSEKQSFKKTVLVFLNNMKKMLHTERQNFIANEWSSVTGIPHCSHATLKRIHCPIPVLSHTQGHGFRRAKCPESLIFQEVFLSIYCNASPFCLFVYYLLLHSSAFLLHLRCNKEINKLKVKN